MRSEVSLNEDLRRKLVTGRLKCQGTLNTWICNVSVNDTEGESGER